ncbi:hypothetical protein ACP70R_003459 [Stipagrostis hirtigluma subsp. patula]
MGSGCAAAPRSALGHGDLCTVAAPLSDIFQAGDFPSERSSISR